MVISTIELFSANLRAAAVYGRNLIEAELIIIMLNVHAVHALKV